MVLRIEKPKAGRTQHPRPLRVPVILVFIFVRNTNTKKNTKTKKLRVFRAYYVCAFSVFATTWPAEGGLYARAWHTAHAAWYVAHVQ